MKKTGKEHLPPFSRFFPPFLPPFFLLDPSHPLSSKDIVMYLEQDDAPLSYGEFEKIRKKSNLIDSALTSQLVLPDFESFCGDVYEIYEETKKDESGANAAYIPQLARVDPNLYGVSVCTIDGQRYDVGDSDHYFCVQSCSKVITYMIAHEEHGEEKVHYHVGREPSGRAFNEVCLDYRRNVADKAMLEERRKEAQAIKDPAERRKALAEVEASVPRPAVPHNPLINAGAIMAASLVQPKASMAERFDNVMQTWRDLCGCTPSTSADKRPTFANSVYLSESATADRNWCLGYLMQEEEAFPKGTNLAEALEFYFMCCSIEVTSSMMSIIAATLANGGLNPINGKRVFSARTVRNALSLMFSCGMYDYSGEFAFTMGFPCKSGVGGALMVRVPVCACARVRVCACVRVVRVARCVLVEAPPFFGSWEGHGTARRFDTLNAWPLTSPFLVRRPLPTLPIASRSSFPT